MRYTLKDYQVGAVRDVLKNLAQARDMYHRYRSLTQFSLTATTGAGKTVMAAAVIEAVFFGNDEFDFEPDPGAVVLWFSDDPSLNEQSRVRIQAASSELDARLRVVESTFSEPSLRPGYVYFLNTQKLSKNSRLVKGDPGPTNGQTTLFEPRPDEVQSSIYDTITNTIKNEDLTLYLVLDEAHRGMGTTNKDHTTIVQRLINGQGSVPPMPVVFGISSATVERFEKAMKDAKSRTALPSVLVDSALVQASGLLKDDIALSIPTEDGAFDTVLLTEAVKKIRASTTAWAQYAQEQGGAEVVVPLLVVQVGDKPSQETLVRTLDTIYEAWPGLAHDSIANVFGEHQDLTVGQQIVPYIEPQRVQDAKYLQVLLAKSAISTGWDCPRAEVLVSFRPAQDRTHITQLLGRMMRTPARATDSRQRTAQLGGLPPAPVQPEDSCRGSGDADEGLDHQGRGRRWRGRGRWTGATGPIRPDPPVSQPGYRAGRLGQVRGHSHGDDPEEKRQADPQAHCAGYRPVEGRARGRCRRTGAPPPSRSARRTGGAVRQEGRGCPRRRAHHGGRGSPGSRGRWIVLQGICPQCRPEGNRGLLPRGDAGDQPGAVLVLRGPSRRPGRGR